MTATVGTRLERLEAKRGGSGHGPPVVCRERDGVRDCAPWTDDQVARAFRVVVLVRSDGPTPNREGSAR